MTEDLSNHKNGQCAEILDTELRRLAWAKHLDEDALSDFIATARVVNFQANAIALEIGQPVTEVFFVVSGSFRVQLMDQLGHEKFRGVVGPGGAIGLLAISCQESSLIRVQALEPSITVSVTFDQLLEFGSRSKAFQKAVLELTADLFVRVSAAQRKLHSPGTVAIVHQSERTSSVTVLLANRLNALGEQPCVLSDLSCKFG